MWVGPWSSSEPYLAGDLVQYQGSCYVALLDSTNISPTANPTYWDLLAAKGDTGAQGIQGIQGIPGAPGAPQTPATTVAAETSFGVASAVGTSLDYARADHTHGTPTDPVTAHVAAGDPHTQYQKESEKSAASGYASLDSGTKVPISELPTGSGATTVCIGNDARLSDARTPTAHATSHKSGGSDAIKLDELAAPTDISTLNADQTKHGLMQKYPGGSTTFLRADGSFAAPTASVADPNPQSYTPGSFTVATGKYVILCKRLQLTGAQRAAAEGTSRIRIT